MTCNPASAGGHKHIIVAIDYFTKWAKAMPTFKVDGETTTFFVFNQIIARFGIPKFIVIDHGSHFQNDMMMETDYHARIETRTFFSILSACKWLG